MTEGGAFSNTDHLRTLSEERQNGKKDRDAAYKFKIKGLVHNLIGMDKRLLLHAKSTSAWMSGYGTILSGIVISSPEF